MGVKSLVQGLKAAATAGFEPTTVSDPKSDAVTDWPLRLPRRRNRLLVTASDGGDQL